MIESVISLLIKTSNNKTKQLKKHKQLQLIPSHQPLKLVHK